MILNGNSVQSDNWRNRKAADDAAFANELVQDMPGAFQRSILAGYVAKYNKVHNREWTNSYGQKLTKQTDGSAAANVFLRLLVQRLRSQKIPLPAIATDETAKAFAVRHARAALFLVADESDLFERYKKLATFASGYGLNIPFADRAKVTAAQLMTGCQKMTCPEWWMRQVKRFASRLREYLAISLGFVGSRGKQSPYASHECRRAYQAKVERNKEFLESNYLALEYENTDGLLDYEVISMAVASKAGVSNPEIKRLELMTRIRGMKTAADEQQLSAMFYTITAPSKYHRNAKKGWNHASPTETQKYLCGQWAKVRAELNDAGVKVAGLRVAEPHADATPHWHMLLFIKPDEVGFVTETLRRYAMQHDPDEPGADVARFKAVTPDPEKGDVVGYIAKYIAKNINGAYCGDDEDFETEGSIADGVLGVVAWASEHGIRQFQFIGGAPVTIWREMRREREEITEESLEKIRLAADKGRFAEWTKLMGGLFVKRIDLPVWLAKEEKASRYGELLKKTVGFIGFGLVVATRRDWIKLGRLPALAFALGQGASRAARSTGNNCKSPELALNVQIKSPERLQIAIEKMGERLSKAAGAIKQKFISMTEVKGVLHEFA